MSGVGTNLQVDCARQISDRLYQIHSNAVKFFDIFTPEITRLREKLGFLLRDILVNSNNCSPDEFLNRIYEMMRNRLVQDIVKKYRSLHKFESNAEADEIYLRHINTMIGFLSSLVHELEAEDSHNYQLLCRINITIGDLNRYGYSCHCSLEGEREDFLIMSDQVYRIASAYDPDYGCCYNQLGILYENYGRALDAIYFYLLALQCHKPLNAARDNLIILLNTSDPLLTTLKPVLKIFLDANVKECATSIVTALLSKIREQLHPGTSVDGFVHRLLIISIFMFEHLRDRSQKRNGIGKTIMQSCLAFSFSIFDLAISYLSARLETPTDFENDSGYTDIDYNSVERNTGLFEQMIEDLDVLNMLPPSNNNDFNSDAFDLLNDSIEQDDDQESLEAQILARKMHQYDVSTDTDYYMEGFDDSVFEVECQKHILGDGFNFVKSEKLFKAVRIYCIWLSLNRRLIKQLSQYKCTKSQFCASDPLFNCNLDLSILLRSAYFQKGHEKVIDLIEEKRLQYRPPPIEDDLELRSCTAFRKHYSEIQFGRVPQYCVKLDENEEAVVIICTLRYFAYWQCRSPGCFLILKVLPIFDCEDDTLLFRLYTSMPAGTDYSLDTLIAKAFPSWSEVPGILEEDEETITLFKHALSIEQDESKTTAFKLNDPVVTVVHCSVFNADWKVLIGIPKRLPCTLIFPYSTFDFFDSIKETEPEIQLMSFWIMMHSGKHGRYVRTYSKLPSYTTEIDYDLMLNEAMEVYRKLRSDDQNQSTTQYAIMVSSKFYETNGDKFGSVISKCDRSHLILVELNE
ncbi:hypothetical protein ACOME3_009516 [Neoechinorhynchus agilis]